MFHYSGISRVGKRTGRTITQPSDILWMLTEGRGLCLNTVRTEITTNHLPDDFIVLHGRTSKEMLTDQSVPHYISNVGIDADDEQVKC